MLPILRTISVGGVLLAITILALALSPPGGSHLRLAAANASARGALLAQDNHPEWRQFLIQAALRRAGELDRLRDLPDTAMRLPEIPDVAPDYVPAELTLGTPLAPAKNTTRIAGLPEPQTDLDPEEVTGSVDTVPGATIPIEIGEPSSFELPVHPVDDRPPAITVPLTETPAERQPADAPATQIVATETLKPIKMPVESRERTAHRGRANTPGRQRAQAPEAAPLQVPPPFNLLQALFESLTRNPAANPRVNPKVKAVTGGRSRSKAKRTASIRAVSQ